MVDRGVLIHKWRFVTDYVPDQRSLRYRIARICENTVINNKSDLSIGVLVSIIYRIFKYHSKNILMSNSKKNKKHICEICISNNDIYLFDNRLSKFNPSLFLTDIQIIN